MTWIQLALDTATTAEALAIAEAAIDHVDVLEAGTVLILSEGLGAVRALREAFPHHSIVADVRIGRAGAKFADLAFEAGASAVTVLGECPMDVVEGALFSAREHAGVVEVELPARWSQDDLSAWADAGVTTLIAHRSGHFGAAEDHEIRDVLRRLAACDRGGMDVTLAGGFALGDSAHYEGLAVDIVAVGSAIAKAADPAQAAARLRAELART